MNLIGLLGKKIHSEKNNFNHQNQSTYSDTCTSSTLPLAHESQYTSISDQPQGIKHWDEREIRPQSRKLSLGFCIECRRQLSGMKWCRTCNAKHFKHQISKWRSCQARLDSIIINTQITANNVHSFFEWVPFKDFTNVTYLTKGGYSKVYKAIWTRGPIICWDTTIDNWDRFGDYEVVLKVIEGSQKHLDEFINELSAHHKFNTKVGHILRCFGISRWEDTGEFIVVTSYAKDGNLREYINIAKGLKIIHDSGYVHRDLHAGNILRHGSWTMISDLGFTWRQDSTSPGELFGVLPYMAPEILRNDKGQFSSASDIYSFAMIMYEIASGERPFYNITKDITPISIVCGSRPDIPLEIPHCYIELMESCWDFDPKKRPTADHLVRKFDDWIHSRKKKLNYIYDSFQKAEYERKNPKCPKYPKCTYPTNSEDYSTHIDESCTTSSQIINIPSYINVDQQKHQKKNKDPKYYAYIDESCTSQIINIPSYINVDQQKHQKKNKNPKYPKYPRYTNNEDYAYIDESCTSQIINIPSYINVDQQKHQKKNKNPKYQKYPRYTYPTNNEDYTYIDESCTS